MTAEVKFGTDGWRGIIADDFTFDRLKRVARSVVSVLYELQFQTESPTADKQAKTEIIVGYDRRFLSPEFARSIALEMQSMGFDVWLGNQFAPTPAFSWSAFQQRGLGALIITASHNPPHYSGLKIKGAFGGSVAQEITSQVEAKLQTNSTPVQLARPGKISEFDPWESYCQELQTKVDIALIQKLVKDGQLTIISDVLHGCAATGLERLLGIPITELRSTSDPLFGGASPEPLAPNLTGLISAVQKAETPLAIGFAFDGDSDRIACIDRDGTFLSSQILIPVLTAHLVENRHKTGAFIKTISGSDLMPKVAEFYGLTVYETPVGFKYLAEKMLCQPTVIAGEESGGIGYGDHIPERDALLSALYVLEVICTKRQNLGQTYQALQKQVNFYPVYDRIDVRLTDMTTKQRLESQLVSAPPQLIANFAVRTVTNPDGFKFRLENDSWLLIRFSGTEPVLRLYCEALDRATVEQILSWIKAWAEKV